MHEGESAIAGAVREAQEEAGVPDGAVRPRFTSVLDLDIWSYTTVVADVVAPFDPVISDRESVALEWVPVANVSDLPLHPGFASAWPMLRSLLDVRPVVVVDAANVVGSVPDGWWKDRLGAAERLRDRLGGLTVDGADLSLGGARWFPSVALVVEGKARHLAQDSADVTVVRAEGAGDDAIVAEVERRVAEGDTVIAVTSDRELQERVAEAGASAVRSVRWLLERISYSGR